MSSLSHSLHVFIFSTIFRELVLDIPVNWETGHKD